ncbi:hypothetical protein [Bacillus inaquosorum]|uniref:hypothetical protein n=1 Tax=Bacillus inaquosorum TaxID=483913 RepID=UPI002E1C7D42|nr:hypothetical protein [Bacillus inaquosorum]MED1540952.1 hypothetical protein [Bacillus inaquosorum]
MNKEMKDTIAESLLEILPPLTNAVNDMINAAKGNVLYKELLPKVQELSIQSRALLKPAQSYLNNIDVPLEQKENEVFKIWLGALEDLIESIEIFIDLIREDIRKNGNAENFQEEEKKNTYTLTDAVDYLFEASRKIGNLIDILYK